MKPTDVLSTIILKGLDNVVTYLRGLYPNAHFFIFYQPVDETFIVQPITGNNVHVPMHITKNTVLYAFYQVEDEKNKMFSELYGQQQYSFVLQPGVNLLSENYETTELRLDASVSHD